ncbi:DNA-binding protein [Microbulbifer sp. 2304DJ12-6]|uniref:DNA-binding protein n=1 Tax=Microbulbifer sp. 2304DJ12-6 TaxID=3233340 RepID=UPI0039B0255E
MARIGVTYLDIVQAANAIKARDEEPTVDRVRTQLGTGSKSTIAPLLKRWRSETASNTDVSGLPRDLVEALKKLHQHIQGDADQRVAQNQQEHQKQQNAQLSQLAQAREAEAKQSARVRELEQKLSLAEADRRSLKQAVEEKQAALEKCEYQRQEAVTRIEEQKNTIKEMKLENRDIREHFEHFQENTANDRQYERDQFHTASEQLKEQIAALTEQLSLAEHKFSELNLLYNQGQVLVTELNHKKQEMHEQIGAVQAKREALQQQNAEQGRQLESKMTEVANLQAQIVRLQGNNSAFCKESQLQRQSLDKLESELAAAQDRLEQLLDENRRLLQEKAIIQGQFKQLESSLESR